MSQIASNLRTKLVIIHRACASFILSFSGTSKNDLMFTNQQRAPQPHRGRHMLQTLSCNHQRAKTAVQQISPKCTSSRDSLLECGYGGVMRVLKSWGHGVKYSNLSFLLGQPPEHHQSHKRFQDVGDVPHALNRTIGTIWPTWNVHLPSLHLLPIGPRGVLRRRGRRSERRKDYDNDDDGDHRAGI